MIKVCKALGNKFSGAFLFYGNNLKEKFWLAKMQFLSLVGNAFLQKKGATTFLNIANAQSGCFEKRLHIFVNGRKLFKY